MIDMHLFVAFVLAVTVLMLIPGPNVALIVANSVTYGVRYGFLTVAGTSAAMVVQLGLTALGMTELLGSLGALVRMDPLDRRRLSRLSRRHSVAGTAPGSDRRSHRSRNPRERCSPARCWSR